MEHDRAIVLRLTEYSESSQIATMYARSAGKLRLLAKGAKRSTKARFSPGMDLLELGDVVYIRPRGDTQLGTLAEWRQLSLFLDLRTSLRNLQAATYVIESLNVLTEDSDPHPDLFDATVQTLNRFAYSDDPLAVVTQFQRTLLHAVGFDPNFSTCVRCGARRTAGRSGRFAFAVGGLICRNCIRPSDRSVLVSANLLDRQLAGSAEWFPILDAYVTFIAERAIRSASAMQPPYQPLSTDGNP
ncbi:MAG: DNA repair protein RecO [Phycisphaerae bacterium]